MLEARGNLWDFDRQALVITTNGYTKKNGDAVMGRGCAREAAVRYPDLPAELGAHLRTKGNHVRMWDFYDYHTIIAFPVKHVWWEPADPELIERSAKELAELCNDNGIHLVVMPRPGCGNGQLEWDDVRPILEPILDDRFTVVTF